MDGSADLHTLSPSGASTDRSANRRRRQSAAAIVVAVVVAFGYWAVHVPNRQAEHTVPIVRAFVASPNAYVLNLSVGAGCTATRVITAQVDEGVKTIRITVRAKNDYVPTGQPALGCLPGVAVHLRGPLGQRSVIDESSGKVIGVRA